MGGILGVFKTGFFCAAVQCPVSQAGLELTEIFPPLLMKGMSWHKWVYFSGTAWAFQTYKNLATFFFPNLCVWVTESEF